MATIEATTGGPTGELRSEHRVIERGLGVLDRLLERAREGGPFETDALRRCVEFFRLYADACHHAKEEDLLFPALEARGIPRAGGPIGVLLEEHRRARRLVAEMAGALGGLEPELGDRSTSEDRFLAAADDYLELLRGHIFKEDNGVFEMGDQVLTGDDGAALVRGFCDLRCRAFGGKTRDQLEEIVERLEAEWPA